MNESRNQSQRVAVATKKGSAAPEAARESMIEAASFLTTAQISINNAIESLPNCEAKKHLLRIWEDLDDTATWLKSQEAAS